MEGGDCIFISSPPRLSALRCLCRSNSCPSLLPKILIQKLLLKATADFCFYFFFSRFHSDRVRDLINYRDPMFTTFASETKKKWGSVNSFSSLPSRFFFFADVAGLYTADSFMNGNVRDRIHLFSWLMKGRRRLVAAGRHSKSRDFRTRLTADDMLPLPPRNF